MEGRMSEKLVLLDGSRKLHCRIPLEAIEEIQRIRNVDIEYHECPDFLRQFEEMAYEPRRKQVNAHLFTQALHMTDEMKTRHSEGKLIILDSDIYSGDSDCNWFFGGYSQVQDSLGYVTLSTARVNSNIQARDLIRHELGHMFGAPSTQRSNTYELGGLHCSNDLCVMQQKMSVDEAIKYSQERARLNAETYCPQCQLDIKQKPACK